MIKAFTQNENYCRVINYTTDSIKLLGFGTTSDHITEDLKQPILLAQSNSGNPYKTDVKCNSKATPYLFVEIRGKVIAVAINPWEEPNKIPAYQDVLHSFNLDKYKS